MTVSVKDAGDAQRERKERERGRDRRLRLRRFPPYIPELPNPIRRSIVPSSDPTPLDPALDARLYHTW